jgi:hypothetical protein
MAVLDTAWERQRFDQASSSTETLVKKMKPSTHLPEKTSERFGSKPRACQCALIRAKSALCGLAGRSGPAQG